MSVNPAMAAGTALVGSFLFGATMAINGGMRIALTNSDATDFTKKQVAVRAELRCSLFLPQPGAGTMPIGRPGFQCEVRDCSR